MAPRVVCAVEGDDHVPHCAAMLHSLLVHHRGAGVRIDYLHGDDTSSRGRSRIERMVSALGGEISFHEVSDRWVEGLPIKDFTRKATWYRISLDELLPDADRILYLDLDLLVRDSLLPLWGTPLGSNLVGAVTNVPPEGEYAYNHRPELGGDPYFNAGVLLLDLAGIRREQLGARMRAFSRQNADRLRWRDQDTLNEVLHDRRLPLHPRWNCMNAIVNFDYATGYFDPRELEEARRRPAIRHFEGPLWNKPWHLLCDPETRRPYLEHRRQTPWPRVRFTGCTPGNLVRYARRRFV
jgi:UDP-glucose/galactose:(glucosyl)LPS alpha-1,2-glucosyl/galactosyltransferase